MGRKKIELNLIRKENLRKATFKKRKECLIRKTQELCTLCDVKACIVIYGSSCNNTPEIWPEKVDDMIELYKKSAAAGRHNSKFELKDYFNVRRMEVEKKLSKLVEKKMEAKYPTPVNMLNEMSESELREFGAKLRNRAEYVRSRLVQMTAAASSSNNNKPAASSMPPQLHISTGTWENYNDGGLEDLTWENYDDGGLEDLLGGELIMPMMINNDVQQFGFKGTAASSMPPQLHISTGTRENYNDGGLEDLTWENYDDGGLEDLLSQLQDY